MLRFVLAFLLAAVSAADLSAEKVLVISGGAYFLLDVAPGGKPTLVEISRVVNLDGPNAPPAPDPQPNPTDPLRAKSLHLARFTGDPTGAKGLSLVYSLVSDQLDAGKLSPSNTFNAVSVASDAALNSLGTANKWVDWRKVMGDDLTAMLQRGELTTAAQQSAALRSIASGLDDYLGTSGILGDIDWAKLIELILLIMKLIGGFG